MSLTKIISGGQTGADQGALRAAKALGLATSGYMPRDYRTETGPRPDLAQEFGLHQTQSSGYPVRTYNNVLMSDGTLIFGRMNSRGVRLTKCFIMDLGRPSFLVTWPHANTVKDYHYWFIHWLEEYRIKVLNVAGNREERNPGIGEAVGAFLTKAVEAIREKEKENVGQRE